MTDTERRGEHGDAQRRIYLLHIEGGASSQIWGPFASEEERDARARELRCEDDLMFQLYVSPSGVPAVFDYSGAFYQEQE